MLGTDVVNVLHEHDHEVYECDMHNCDILDYEQLEGMIAEADPDVILHTAAYTNVDRAETDEDTARRVNVTGTAHVAELAKTYTARLVHLSTDYVFDGTKTFPYTEDDTPNPAGAYGRTKWQAEEQIQRLFNEQQGFLIVRTAWLYGRHGKNFVSAIVQRAQQQNTVQVVNDQTGSPTLTMDLARAILALIDYRASGIVHVSNSGSCTWYEFARAILEQAGLSDVTVQPITTSQLGRPAPRPAFSVLDTSKFTTLTGQTLPHWKEGLQEYFFHA